MTFKVLDLFSGIGGFSLGLERTGGFKTVAFCEIDNYCQRVLHKHWPEVYIHSDIRTLTGKHFNGWERPDVICGGFPCQDISSAGQRAGITGERSGLYRELVRSIRMARPKYAIVENVAALLGRGMGDVLGDLAESGYDAEWDCVPAYAVGSPQGRDRVWIVAYPEHNGCASPEITESVSARVGASVREERAEQPARPSGSKVWNKAVVCDPAGEGFPDWAGGTVGQPEPLTQFERPDGREIERQFCGVAYGVSNRVDRIKALGNSIVPQIATWIGQRILEASKVPPEAPNCSEVTSVAASRKSKKEGLR